MKVFNLLSLSLILVAITATKSVSQTVNPALDYLNKISDEYRMISASQWDYMKATSHSKAARKIEKRREELIATTRNSINNMKRLPDYEGNTTLRDSIIASLEISYHILSDEYAKIIDMEEIAEQSYDQMEEFLLTRERINSKYQAAGESAEIEFKKFAASNNITINENENKLSDKLKQGNKVWEYYNVVYLVFFKSQFQEQNLIEAMNSSEVAAIEQSKNTLLQYTDEGLKKLYSLPNFDNDNTLKVATMNTLKFYQKEANDFVPSAIDFLLAKDNMNSLTKLMETKKKSEITQQDIDNYNKAVSDYNQKVKTNNEMNDNFNKERNLQLDTWNKTAKKFVDKHVP